MSSVHNESSINALFLSVKILITIGVVYILHCILEYFKCHVERNPFTCFKFMRTFLFYAIVQHFRHKLIKEWICSQNFIVIIKMFKNRIQQMNWNYKKYENYNTKSHSWIPFQSQLKALVTFNCVAFALESVALFYIYFIWYHRVDSVMSMCHCTEYSFFNEASLCFHCAAHALVCVSFVFIRIEIIWL